MTPLPDENSGKANQQGVNEGNVYSLTVLLNRPGGYPIFRLLVDDCCPIYSGFLDSGIRDAFALALLTTLERFTAHDHVFLNRRKELIFTVFKELFFTAEGNAISNTSLLHHKILQWYFELCLSPAGETWFKDNGYDREETVIRALFETGKPPGNPLQPRRRLFQLLRQHPALAERLRRWFLGSYNLYVLKFYEKALDRTATEESNREPPPPSRETGPADTAAAAGGEAAGRPEPPVPVTDTKNSLLWFAIPGGTLLILLAVYRLFPGAWQLAAGLSPPDQLILPLKTFFILAGSLVVYHYCRRSTSTLRLWACILAGYLALLSDESWTGIIPLFSLAAGGPQFNLEKVFKLVLHWVIFGGFTVVYLHREISNKLEAHKLALNFKTAVNRKTLAFSLRATGYALIIGIMISDFFGSTMLARNQQEINAMLGPGTVKNLLSVPFLYHRIYPEIILAQAPTAMFIGIFINLLWEDKPLTEPL